MALSDKIADLVAQLQQVQEEAKTLEAPKDDQPSVPAAGEVADDALKALQAKVDALGQERDAIAADRDKYLGLINDHIADEEGDVAKLKAAVAPIQPVPVEAEVPVVAEEVQGMATPVSAGIQ